MQNSNDKPPGSLHSMHNRSWEHQASACSLVYPGIGVGILHECLLINFGLGELLQGRRDVLQEPALTSQQVR